ncbi:MAG TPA: hypothetical protein VGM31_11255 [Puia sp.]
MEVSYECYLIKTNNINFPIWTADMGTKAPASLSYPQPTMKMARALAKELKKEGYLMH